MWAGGPEAHPTRASEMHHPHPEVVGCDDGYGEYRVRGITLPCHSRRASA
jgi:hypothetical protein